jgi:hypothetical protein
LNPQQTRTDVRAVNNTKTFVAQCTQSMLEKQNSAFKVIVIRRTTTNAM